MKNILTIVMIIAGMAAYSQATNHDQVTGMLKKIAEQYRSAQYLSFDVKYRYASAADPEIYLDSLDGSFRINGSAFWYALDKTETLFNGAYVVVLYKEDNIIYISKPSASLLPGNPVAAIDSLLNNPDLSYSISHEGKKDLITIDFPEKAPIKQLRYEIDKRSGYISKITQLVKSSQLADPNGNMEQPAADNYSIVETVFDHYQQNKFTGDALNLDQYFKKEGNEYVAASAYQSYKIFLGSPGL